MWNQLQRCGVIIEIMQYVPQNRQRKKQTKHCWDKINYKLFEYTSIYLCFFLDIFLSNALKNLFSKTRLTRM